MTRVSKVLVIVLLGTLLGGWMVPCVQAWFEPPEAAPRPIAPRGDLSPEEQLNIRIFRESSPSVVFITTLTQVIDPFRRTVRDVAAGEGSGFLWDEEGHVVTNFHVVGMRGASGAKVTLADHTTYDAKWVGASPENDIAVLQIDAPHDKLVPIPVGTSHDLQVGQKVFAIGNPFGWDQTLTVGVISALDRTIESVAGTPIQHVVQTDAPINPGNSGGPLIDSAGRLIGMNTAIYSPTHTSAGIGFAIPVDTINRVVPQLIAHGRVVAPRLGILASDRDAEELGIAGIHVREVLPGTGAAKAGLRGMSRDDSGDLVPGDIIVEVDGHRVTTLEELHAVLSTHRPGDVVEVKILRGREQKTVQVRLMAPNEV